MAARGPSSARGAAPAEKVSAELFTLTYGAMVRQLLHDHESLKEVNARLETMGYNMGVRLVDDFLANAPGTKCGDFRSAAESIARLGFRNFLGVNARVGAWSEPAQADAAAGGGAGAPAAPSPETACSIFFEDNPLTDFVELPQGLEELSYVSALCGVIRGALEQIGMDVAVTVAKDMLKGDDGFELRLVLKNHKPEEYPFKDDE